MTIELKVYDNGDHTCVVWLPSDEKPIPDCLGFTVHRTLKPNGGGAAREDYLHGFVGFSDAEKLDPTAPWKFPIQRYLWSDYGVSPGDVVQYSVVPVCGPDKDHIALKPELGSAQTPPMTIAGQASAHVSAYFNKGIVSARDPLRGHDALVKTGGDMRRRLGRRQRALGHAPQRHRASLSAPAL